MITPAEISEKAARIYPEFLKAWLRGEPFFPQSFAVGRLPKEYAELSAAVDRLLKGARGERGAGYTVDLQLRHTQRFGAQSLPSRVLIERERDLLALINKEQEWQSFQQDVALIRRELPALNDWMAQQPLWVVEYHGVWPELLRVCAYFLANPRPGLYSRELPMSIHTKFIEEHMGILRRLLETLLPVETIDRTTNAFERRFGLRYDEPLIRMRFLDDLLGQRYGLHIADVSVPIGQLAALPLHGQRCLIVENKMTFLTLPGLPDAYAIFGQGFSVQLLAEARWLAAAELIYWGDLDAQGFQILASLRALFPHARSIMMDFATLNAFSGFVVSGTPCAVRELPHLTSEEHEVFIYLAQTQKRLEQERIDQAYSTKQLLTVFRQ